MRETRDIMGMPVIVEIPGEGEKVSAAIEKAFAYFCDVDERFSTYKEGSEISKMNRGELPPGAASPEMKEVLRLSEETKRMTNGYFDITRPNGVVDPSGLVKGWAIQNAARLIAGGGFADFYVEAGGDIQTSGKNAERLEWKLGIRNPFNRDEIIKIICPKGKGVATSGTAARGRHIYDPHTRAPAPASVVSLTVVGPDVYEADRFATAAFAMGRRGLEFIEDLPEFEAYLVNSEGIASWTSGFEQFVC